MKRRSRKPPSIVQEDVRRTRAALLGAIDRRASLREVEIAYVRYVLTCLGGNKVHAARAIEVDRRTIQRWERTWLGDGSRSGRDGRADSD